MRRAVPLALPWALLLPGDAVDDFTTEYIQAVQRSTEIVDATPAWQLITRWRHAAEIYAAPDLYDALTRSDHRAEDPVTVVAATP